MRIHQIGSENCDGGEVVGAVSANSKGSRGSWRVGELMNWRIDAREYDRLNPETPPETPRNTYSAPFISLSGTYFATMRTSDRTLQNVLTPYLPRIR
ncbi:hypothetical protein N7453_004347 [Penicillium expansum]|nr:hypothetical protein N7453_004347 [Penicillium expansum]